MRTILFKGKRKDNGDEMMLKIGDKVVLLDNYSGGYAVDGLSLAKEDKMTPQEAIEILRTSIHISGKGDEVCKELEARQIAVLALKKKIAKKPKEEANEIDNQIDFLCPDCGFYLADITHINYCTRCGRAIDWSDIND